MGWIETIVVALIVLAAVAATGVSLWRIVSGRSKSKCASCPLRGDCTAGSDPSDTPPPRSQT